MKRDEKASVLTTLDGRGRIVNIANNIGRLKNAIPKPPHPDFRYYTKECHLKVFDSEIILYVMLCEEAPRCLRCGKPILRGPRAEYCSAKCKRAINMRVYRATKRKERE